VFANDTSLASLQNFTSGQLSSFNLEIKTHSY